MVNYSIPYRGRIGLAELDTHLYSDKTRPDVVPYVTSYYERRWGFCLSHNDREALPEGEYEIVVDTSLDENGSMTISEAILEGDRTDEILFVTHTCHPSMANDQLSGPLATAFLYKRKNL